MTMTPLPPAPSSKDPTSFDDRADELLAVALPRFVEEANDLAEDVSTKQETASTAAVTATGQAGIATTKAGEAGDHADAANGSKEAAAASALSAFTNMGFAEQAAMAANASKLAAAASAATIDPQALSSDYPGPNEPPVMWPYMTWADTATLTIKRRNAANSAWVIEGRLFRNHLPIIPLDEIPTTDIGQISVITIGIMEWDGAAYAPVVIDAANVSYDNTASGLAAEDVQAAVDDVAESLQTLDGQLDFTIVYPNGGTEASPANVAINSSYVTSNPFPGHHVFCIAEIMINGKWGWSGHVSGVSVTQGWFVVASPYEGNIVVETGGQGLTAATNQGGSPHKVGVVTSPAPCRVKVWKLKGAI